MGTNKSSGAYQQPFRQVGHDDNRGTDIYTPEQRAMRDSTIWTPIQGVLAAAQFIVFFISLILVVRFMATGDGFWIASLSVLVKTGLLLTIMVTGAIWEKVVFGQYLFAPSFFWEDVVSFLVITLHLLYVAAFSFDLAPAGTQMLIILAAYAAYVVNAGQFLWKFRQARKAHEGQANESNISTATSGALPSANAVGQGAGS